MLPVPLLAFLRVLDLLLSSLSFEVRIFPLSPPCFLYAAGPAYRGGLPNLNLAFRSGLS